MSIIPWGVYSVYKALGAHRTWRGGGGRLLCENERSKSQHQSRNDSHLQKMPYLKARSVNVPSGRPGNKQSKWGWCLGAGWGPPRHGSRLPVHREMRAGQEGSRPSWKGRLTTKSGTDHAEERALVGLSGAGRSAPSPVSPRWTW